MKLELRDNKDFWAGLVFAGTGAAAMFIARHYPFKFIEVLLLTVLSVALFIWGLGLPYPLVKLLW